MPDEASDQTKIACAYCDSTDTEMFSLFGQALMSSQYYCNNCRSVFEAIRWTEATLDSEPEKED